MANLIEISKQDSRLTDEARKLTEYLVNSGTIQNLNINNERIREVLQKKQEIEFQNTELLLKQYRDIAWQLEYSPYEIAEELNYSCKNIEEVIKAFDYDFILNKPNILKEVFLSK